MTAPPDGGEAVEMPRYGDRVEHFAFGLCDVMLTREGRMKMREVSTGKLREISLSVGKIMTPVERDGRRVFPFLRR